MTAVRYFHVVYSWADPDGSGFGDAVTRSSNLTSRAFVNSVRDEIRRTSKFPTDTTIVILNFIPLECNNGFEPND